MPSSLIHVCVIILQITGAILGRIVSDCLFQVTRSVVLRTKLSCVKGLHQLIVIVIVLRVCIFSHLLISVECRLRRLNQIASAAL